MGLFGYYNSPGLGQPPAKVYLEPEKNRAWKKRLNGWEKKKVKQAKLLGKF